MPMFLKFWALYLYVNDTTYAKKTTCVFRNGHLVVTGKNEKMPFTNLAFKDLSAPDAILK